MGIIIRQSLKASFVTYAGAGLGVVNQLFIATHYLSATELGITRSLLTFASLFSAVFSFGVAAIADRYFSYYTTHKTEHRDFLNLLLIYTGVSLVIFSGVYLSLHQLFAYFYQEKSPELLAFYYQILPFTALLLLQLILESYCRNIRRIAVPALLREIFLRILNIVIILLYGFGFISFDEFIALFIACYGFVVAGLFFYLGFTHHLQFPRLNREKFTNRIIWQMSGFGLVATLGAVGSNLCGYLDQLMLGSLKGQADAGVFGIGLLMASLIEIPRKSLAQISIPFLSKAIQEQNWKEVEARNQNISKHQLLAAGILMLLVVCNLDDIFGIMPKGDIFARSKNVVILLILARMADMQGGMTSEIMGYSKYYRVSTLFVGILAILTYLSNLVLIPRLGITGAALATLITIACYTLARAVFLSRTLHIRIFHVSGGVILVLCAGIYFLMSLLPSLTGDGLSENAAFWGNPVFFSILNICIRSAVISVLYVGVVWQLNLSTEFKSLILSLLSQIRKRK